MFYAGGCGFTPAAGRHRLWVPGRSVGKAGVLDAISRLRLRKDNEKYVPVFISIISIITSNAQYLSQSVIDWIDSVSSVH